MYCLLSPILPFCYSDNWLSSFPNFLSQSFPVFPALPIFLPHLLKCPCAAINSEGELCDLFTFRRVRRNCDMTENNILGLRFHISPRETKNYYSCYHYGGPVNGLSSFLYSWPHQWLHSSGCKGSECSNMP